MARTLYAYSSIWFAILYATLSPRKSNMAIHHLLTGSYTNTSLYLLAFDTIAKTLTLNSTVPGFGLHQFVTSNPARDVIYATTMSEPPRIFSWSRTPDNIITHINTANVSELCPQTLVVYISILILSATSSCYISDNGGFTFSAGGSGARVNAIDDDGGIGEIVDEMFYVPRQEMARVDTTRSAVVTRIPRYFFFWSTDDANG